MHFTYLFSSFPQVMFASGKQNRKKGNVTGRKQYADLQMKINVYIYTIYEYVYVLFRQYSLLLLVYYIHRGMGVHAVHIDGRCLKVYAEMSG